MTTWAWSWFDVKPNITNWSDFIRTCCIISVICFVPPAESRCSISAERLIHTGLKSVVGHNWTSGSWKGQFIVWATLQGTLDRSTLVFFYPCSRTFHLSFVFLGPSIQSSLLSSILGELPNEKGVLKVKGQLTYAAQQPWVYPGTIRSNILFGKELNPQTYDKVIRACALKRVSG